MRRKFLSLALCLMMVLSLIAVPVSAEGEVTLLESWFETADGTRVYDTKNAATVSPAFYVNNETGAAITDAKLILASYDANDKLAVVKFTAAPEIPENESRIKIADSIAVSERGETYMMIWDAAYAPIVPKTELTTESSQAEILGASVDGVNAKFSNINNFISLHDLGDKTLLGENSEKLEGYYKYEIRNDSSYRVKRAITITLPETSEVDLTSVVPEFTKPQGATISPSEPQNFTAGAVDYTVTAKDGVTKRTYSVTVEKIAIEYYNEIVDSTFPEVTFAEAAEKANASVSKTNLKLEKVQSSKINNVYTLIPAFYKKSSIDAGKYTMYENLDGEKFSTDYYESSTATEPQAETDVTNNSVKFILDENGNKVMMSNLVLSKDPDNAASDNLVLRYDKRSDSNTSANKFYRYFTSQKRTASTLTKKMTTEFDLYVPNTTPFGEVTYMGLFGAGDSASTFVTLSIAPTKTGDVVIGTTKVISVWKKLSSNPERYGYSDQTMYYTVATLEGKANDWVHLTVDLDWHYNEDKTAVSDMLMTIYADSEYVGETSIIQRETNATIARATFKEDSFKNWPVWCINGSSTTSRGTVYLDNLKAYVVTH